MPTWDPGQYLRFESQRALPVHDLLGRLGDRAPTRIVDLGCGPGTSTAALRARWPKARIEGIDLSEEMLAVARRSDPATVWRRDDLRTWRAAAPYDLVFSNAALHWVPDHAELFPRLLEAVAPGGALAVQMPASSESPVHRWVREVARSATWSSRWGTAVPAHPVEPPAVYYRLLAPRSAAVELWETEYVHVLPDAASIVEWVKGTTLRPYLERLPPADQPSFLADVTRGVAEAYPAEPDGRVLFPFRRQFIVAHR